MRVAKLQRMHEGSMNKASAGEASGRLEELRRGAFYIWVLLRSFAFSGTLYTRTYIHIHVYEKGQ